MKRLLAFLLAACLPTIASAQQHVHTKTCFSRCRPAPQYVERPQYVAPPVDLDKLEATTDRIADEQRYQTHVQYQILSELQQLKLLSAMGAAKEQAKDATLAEIKATEFPRDPADVPATQFPRDPRDVPATQFPQDPSKVPATQYPRDPAGVPPTPFPTAKKQHIAWPTVKRN